MKWYWKLAVVSGAVLWAMLWYWAGAADGLREARLADGTSPAAVTPDALATAINVAVRTPYPTPTPQTEPRRVVRSIYSEKGVFGCSGWVWTIVPLPTDDKFMRPFRMLKREYPPDFVGEGYQYYVSSNPLWDCSAMKRAIEEATR